MHNKWTSMQYFMHKQNKSVQSPCNSSGQEELLDKVKLYENQSL